MSEILLGTCGWSYAEREGILYPYASNKLRQYSSIFRIACFQNRDVLERAIRDAAEPFRLLLLDSLGKCSELSRS
jgi:hypothetical protein